MQRKTEISSSQTTMKFSNATHPMTSTIQFHSTESATYVVLGHGTLSLVNLNEHARLIVSIGCEGVGLFGWDGCVPLDKRGHDTTSRLDTHGQWGNIQKEQVLHCFRLVSGQDSSLDSCSQQETRCS